MNQRVATVAIMIIAVSFAGPAMPGQAATPEGRAVKTDALADLTGLGDNGLRVNPRKWTVAATPPPEGCVRERVPAWALRELCADDDGCLVRLTYDIEITRRAATPRSFVTEASVEQWSVSTGFDTRREGNNGDSISTSVVDLGTFEDYCDFFDDYVDDDGPYFHLVACTQNAPVLSCTLRIDD